MRDLIGLWIGAGDDKLVVVPAGHQPRLIRARIACMELVGRSLDPHNQRFNAERRAHTIAPRRTARKSEPTTTPRHLRYVCL